MGEAALKGAPNPLLDKDFLNHFVFAVLNALETTAQSPSQVVRSEVIPGFKTSGDLAGILGLTDQDWKGNLILAFPKDTILQVWQNMFGEKVNDITPEIKDAVGELTNQVYGQAKTLLNQKGYRLQMAIPTIAYGNFQLETYPPTASLVVEFQLKNSPQHRFFLQVTLSLNS